MKLSLIGPVYPYRGGISHFTSTLARTFVDLGYDLQVISFKRQYPKWLYPGKTDRDPSLIHHAVVADFILDPLYPNTWKKAVQSIVAHESQVAIIEWWTTFWGPAYFLVSKYLHKRGIDIIFLIHNVLPHEEKPWDWIMTNLVLKQGNGFLVQTELERQKLLGVVGKQARIRMQPHPIYDFKMPDRPSKVQARQKLGLPIDAAVILFFGIVRPYKGLNILLESLSILNKSGKNFILIVAGEFWQDEDVYRTQISHLGLEDQVVLFNYYIPNEELPTFFSAADVFTAPYLEGTQSGTTSMALGFGTKIVVSERVAQGIPEGILKTIKTVPAGDPVALAEGIQSAYSGFDEDEKLPPEGNDWKEFVQALVCIASGIS
jgi:D-inositol-3-phosphate glycosyltransferase